MTEIDSIEVQPVRHHVEATIRPPGSKSLTNRALLCAALANGRTVLTGALDSDDTRVMTTCIEQLGINVQSSESGTRLVVEGCGGQFPSKSAELFVGNSGTTIRFLTAALGVAGGSYTLDGIDRMRVRPIQDLVEALNQLGSVVSANSPGGCPPVTIVSPRVSGGRATLKGNLSSQYLSGLMMAAPIATGEICVDIAGELVSKPYVEMTRKVMKHFGVDCKINANFEQVLVAGDQSYSALDYSIEPDASAASYHWAIAAICGGTVKIEGLTNDSIQGDVAFVDCLEQMGCTVDRQDDGIAITGPATRSINVDMSAISDTAQTLAVVALFVPGETTIRGIAHNRIKETNRIDDLATELRKLGATVRTFEDGLAISATSLNPANIETYDDHRMAMSLALAGLKIPGVNILNPGCVSKTYPDFFADLLTVTKAF